MIGARLRSQHLREDESERATTLLLRYVLERHVIERASGEPLSFLGKVDAIILFAIDIWTSCVREPRPNTLSLGA